MEQEQLVPFTINVPKGIVYDVLRSRLCDVDIVEDLTHQLQI